MRRVVWRAGLAAGLAGLAAAGAAWLLAAGIALPAPGGGSEWEGWLSEVNTKAWVSGGLGMRETLEVIPPSWRLPAPGWVRMTVEARGMIGGRATSVELRCLPPARAEVLHRLCIYEFGWPALCVRATTYEVPETAPASTFGGPLFAVPIGAVSRSAAAPADAPAGLTPSFGAPLLWLGEARCAVRPRVLWRGLAVDAACWMAPVVVLAWPLRWVRRLLRRRWRACAACGYDLGGNTTGVCPECGARRRVHGRGDRRRQMRRWLKSRMGLATRPRAVLRVMCVLGGCGSVGAMGSVLLAFGLARWGTASPRPFGVAGEGAGGVVRGDLPFGEDGGRVVLELASARGSHAAFRTLEVFERTDGELREMGIHACRAGWPRMCAEVVMWREGATALTGARESFWAGAAGGVIPAGRVGAARVLWGGFATDAALLGGLAWAVCFGPGMVRRRVRGWRARR